MIVEARQEPENMTKGVREKTSKRAER